MISFKIAASESALAEPLIAETEARLAPGQSPLWVSDGLEAYGAALFNRHHRVETFPRIGKRGRPAVRSWWPARSCAMGSLSSCGTEDTIWSVSKC